MEGEQIVGGDRTAAGGQVLSTPDRHDKVLEAIQAVMAKARLIFARVSLLLDDLKTSQAAIWADMVAFSREMSLDRAVPVN